MIRFGTSGWRAVISDEFTFRNVRLVSQAIVNVLRREHGDEASAIVGYDTRFLSERVAAESAAVLTANRVRAFLCERDAPTPAVVLELLARGARAGVYFTASHNPPEYNGLKYYTARGAPAPSAATDLIELEVLRLANEGFERKYLLDEGFLVRVDPQEGYLKHVLARVDLDLIRRAGIRIAVDTLFGTGRDYLDRAFIENDCPAEVIHNFADPYFGGYSPECAEKNLGELKTLMADSQSTLGLATDGDGDRFGVLDADRSFVPADDVLPLLVDYLATTGRLSVGFARTVATSHLIDKVAGRHGLKVRETPVGFKHIAELLLAGEVGGGGEESAGIGLGWHLPEKDGVLAALLVAEMVAARGQSLAAQRERLWAEHGPHHHRRLAVDANPEVDQRLRRLAQSPPAELDGMRVVEVTRTDGIKLHLADGSWCLLRRSGTEPVTRIYAESGSALGLERLLHAARELLSGDY